MIPMICRMFAGDTVRMYKALWDKIYERKRDK